MSELTVLPAWIQLPPVDPSFGVQALAMVDTATDLVVDCDEMRAMADADLAKIKVLRKSVDGQRKEMKDPVNAAGKIIEAAYKPALDFLVGAEKLLTDKILGYDRVVKQRRAEEQRVAEEEAARTRAVLEAQAESLKEVAPAAAASITAAAAMVRASSVPMAVARNESSTDHRVTWSAKVNDREKLLWAILEGVVPFEAVDFNMTYLNGRARLEKAAMAIPGVEAVATEGLSARRAA